MFWPLLFSTFPFIVFLFVLLGLRRPLWFASALSFGSAFFIASIYWGISPIVTITSSLRGVLIALDIFVIIFGAIFFLELLTGIDGLRHLAAYLESFSSDYRVQVITLAWLLENFLEGTAGFGVPGAVVAPLLVGLGLSPLRAAILALLGNSTAGVFGAAGTPIRVGLAGLNISQVPILAASLNLVGAIVPIFMLWILVAGKADRREQFREGLPFAIWAGLAFVLSSWLTVWLGQEFPSIVGSALAIGMVVYTTRRGWFVPKKIRRESELTISTADRSLTHVLLPYGCLVGLLLAGKFLFGAWGFVVPFGVNHRINLFNPGVAFIIAGVMIAWRWRRRAITVWEAVKISWWRAIEPFVVIALMSGTVQLLIHTGRNTSALPSAIEVIARAFSNAWLPFWSPFLGAFGSFVTGSVTISNIMFGQFFAVAADAMGMKVALVLALGVVGAAAGNMMALADIMSAEAVLRLRHQERTILRGVFVPCLIYLMIIGLFGLAVVKFF